MLPKLKLVICQGNKVVETIEKESDTQPAQMIESLNEFRQLVNAALTKLIEDPDDLSEEIEDEESSDEDGNPIQVSPKRKKK